MHGCVPFSAMALSALLRVASARNLGLPWRPARDTVVTGCDHDSGGINVDTGVTPVPTEVPRRPSKLARMELFKRY